MQKILDWLYDITEKMKTPLQVIYFIVSRILIITGIIFVLYWIGKAIVGFIKYYSQFA